MLLSNEIDLGKRNFPGNETMELPDYGFNSKKKGVEKIAIFSGAFSHIVDGVTLTLSRLTQHLKKKGTKSSYLPQP